MKKNKHITVNLTEADYTKIKAKADYEKRTLTNIIYLLITRQLKQEE